MRTLAILVVNFVALANGRLNIFPVLSSGFLNITCTYEDTSLSNLQNIVSLVINKYNVSSDGHQQVLNAAYVNSFGISKNNFSNTNVYGRVGNTLFSDVTVQGQSDASWLEGHYECELYGIDQDALPLLMTASMTLNLKDIDPVVSVTPGNIKEGVTSSLVVDCALINYRLYNIYRMLSIEMFHDFNGTREVIFSDKLAPPTIASGWKTVSKYQPDYDKGPSYLAVSKNKPTQADSGTYTCVITAKDYAVNFTIIRDANVTFSTTDIQEAFSRICDNSGLEDYILFACNFENGLCGMNVDPFNPGRGWKIMQSRIQKLFGSVNAYRPGYYLQFSPYDYYGNGTVETALFQPRQRNICVSLWYSVVNFGGPSLSLYIRQINNAQTSTTISYGNSPTPWTFIRRNFPAPDYPFVVGILASSTRGQGAEFMIDNIAISDMNCN